MVKKTKQEGQRAVVHGPCVELLGPMREAFEEPESDYDLPLTDLFGVKQDGRNFAVLNRQTASISPSLSDDFEMEPFSADVKLHHYVSKQIIMLHLCSGHRRQGDFRSHLDGLIPRSGCVIMTLSIDAVFGPKGNLCDARTARFWALQIITGPPCESWSVSRFGAQEGTRPVRSRETPRRLHGDSMRSYSQVHAANMLLHVSMIFIALLLQTGGFGALEHPDVISLHESCSAPSIWFLRCIKALRSHPGIKDPSLEQSSFGAKTRKPTRFLCFRLPTFAARMFQLERAPEEPLEVFEGVAHVDGKREFHTRQTKQHPSRLNQVLATSICDAMERLDLRKGPPEAIPKCVTAVINTFVQNGSDSAATIGNVCNRSAVGIQSW